MDESPKPREEAKTVGDTRGEDRERVELCRKLLATHVSESDIERSLAGEFGAERRAARRYLARARRSLQDAADRSRDAHRAEAYAFYSSLIASTKVKDADRIKAQERIVKLLGLESAPPVESADFDRQPITLAWVLTNMNHSAPPPTSAPGNVIGA